MTDHWKEFRDYEYDARDEHTARLIMDYLGVRVWNHSMRTVAGIIAKKRDELTDRLESE